MNSIGSLASGLFLVLPLLALGGLGACAHQGAAPATEGSWSIVIHGGAGTLDRTAPEAELDAYRASLRAALQEGRDRLARGQSALDVCEAVVRILEDDPRFNAGRGAVFNERGGHELDASIMDGSTLRCGAVAGVRTVKNPISLARLVMEKTRHVLLMGDGAEEFAGTVGVERVPNSYFDTEHRRKILEEVLRERARTDAGAPSPGSTYGTVGCVVRDARGNLAAATSTGGMTAKKFGRVGDSPIIGAGNYADAFAAVSCTGTGEEFIRHGVARVIAARMQFGGQSLDQAARAVVFKTLKKDDGGIIAVDRAGNMVALYNSEGMYRGMADSSGRFEVRIFEE
ncbi:MAG: isoaspartyl peptidase/L-asparaginase [Phycisphaeraceae bacterium]|nr:isoaspartyl peptidase/L-asparaginase [Phycisphaeraceae bacterium]